MREYINQEALQAHLRSLAESIKSAPPEVQAEAARHRAIEMHNAEVDRKKALKRQLRDMAKKLGMPVDRVKRMIGGAVKGK